MRRLMSINKTTFLVALICIFSCRVSAKNEIADRNIVVAQPRAACYTNAFTRPCPITRAAALIDARHIPDDWQCPCPIANPADGSGFLLNPTGSVVQRNPDDGFFVDEVIASGFDNPVGMTFTDNSDELFVATRNGLIWYINLISGEKHLFADFNLEVGLSGDRGLMDIVAHPNYNNVHQLLLHYTVDPTPNDGEEPDAETPVNQRAIRIQDNGGGVYNPNFRITLYGQGTGDGVPICFNTHAVGALKFGLDGSLVVTTGEGAHWNFDMGDFGQDALIRFDAQGNQIPSLDPECVTRFGPEEDIGAWRAQVRNSLGGKLLRIAPDSGDGICPGSPQGQGYAVYNPYCDGTNGTSKQSKVWASGLRNPFRAVVRPLFPGEAYFGGPGTVYFGDVGQGGYEEINAVTQAGMNFGWPCWEGPMPSPMYRDSLYNDDANYYYDRGCGGLGQILGPCGNITTVAYDHNGIRLTCPHMYKNYTTHLPFFFWSRFRPDDNAGYFSECGYTGQGVYGQTTAGLAFYTGNKYPTRYKNSLFALEFSQQWIRTIFVNSGDTYGGVQDFADLIFTPPANGAKVTLANGPDGNICYLTMNGGDVRCFRYVATNVAPSVFCSAVENAGVAPFNVQFKADGTFDRENDPMTFRWDFGDGTGSTAANPTKLYNTNGNYSVWLFATDKYNNTGNCTLTVYVGNARPVVKINSPVPNYLGTAKVFASNETVFFNATVIDERPNTLSYRWELQIVHNNHIHPDAANFYTKTVSRNGASFPNEGTIERNNLKIVLHVTDDGGFEAIDTLRLSPQGWEIYWGGNAPPNAQFTYNNGYLPIEVGQPVRFDASGTLDPNGDYVDYAWNFGDGFTSSGVTNTHVYSTAGTYTVTLNTTDNWGGISGASAVITVAPQTALEPAVTPGSSEQYADFLITMSTVQAGGSIRYTTDGNDPSVVSTLYTGPFTFPHTRYTNVTLKARTFAAGVQPSNVVTAFYEMLPAPCNVLAIAGNCSLVCSNPVNPLAPGYHKQLPAANNVNFAGVRPQNNFQVLRYLIDRLYGVYDPSKNSTVSHLFLDGGSTPGQASQIRVSYDWTNDGTWDRVELFNLFACDPVPDTFEEYNMNYPMRFQTVTGGMYQNLVNGSVMMEIWQALGPGSPQMKLKTDSPLDGQQSNIAIPYTNTYQDGPNPDCDLQCNGPTFFVDVCGTCNGAGFTGCDSNCFSTKTYDECGVCDGPGRTGCDSVCFSTKVVDSCGVCGGNGNCDIPDNTTACGSLGFRKRCNDMLCSVLMTDAGANTTVPAPMGAGSNGAPPANQALILSYTTDQITGFYNIDQKYTKVTLILDAGAVQSTGVQLRISYDFDGNNVWDRLETWDFFPPNDLWNWERFYGIGAPQAEGGRLAPAAGTPAPFQNMVNGKVRIEMWQALASNSPVYIRTDVHNDGWTSQIEIPYITAYRPYDYTCATPIPVTTGPYTTGAVTSGGITTARPGLTTRGLTTGSISTGAITTGRDFTTGAITSGDANNPESTTGEQGQGSSTTGVASGDPCANYQCPDVADMTCKTPGSGYCVVQNNQPVCRFANVPVGTNCTINNPPNLCYDGQCSSGACIATNGLKPCGGTDPDQSSAASLIMSIFALIAAIFFL